MALGHPYQSISIFLKIQFHLPQDTESEEFEEKEIFIHFFLVSLIIDLAMKDCFEFLLLGLYLLKWMICALFPLGGYPPSTVGLN